MVIDFISGIVTDLVVSRLHQRAPNCRKTLASEYALLAMTVIVNFEHLFVYDFTW